MSPCSMKKRWFICRSVLEKARACAWVIGKSLEGSNECREDKNKPSFWEWLVQTVYGDLGVYHCCTHVYSVIDGEKKNVFN